MLFLRGIVFAWRFLRGDTMKKENVRCPMCGTMNYDVDLDETGGWTKCRLCKAVTCSMDEWKKHTVSVPLLNEKHSLRSGPKRYLILSVIRCITGPTLN